MRDTTSDRRYLRFLPVLALAATSLLAVACSDPQGPGVEELASFAIVTPDSIPSGAPFELTVEAVGVDGTRPLAHYEGVVALTVSLGTITPDRMTLADGTATAQVVLGPDVGEVELAVSGAGRSTVSVLEVTAPRRLLGSASSPAVEAIPELAFHPDPDSYEVGHPELPGIEVSVNTVLSTISPASTVEAVNALLADHDAEIVGGIPGEGGATAGLLFLRLPLSSHEDMGLALEALESDPSVEVATADYLMEAASLPGSGSPAAGWIWDGELNGDGNWGFELGRVPQMWNLNGPLDALGDRSVPVGVVDRELGTHVDLSPAGVYGPTTPAGHGTHVSGIIGADFDNGFGVDGVSPYVALHLASLEAVTKGTIFDGLRTVAQAGARVVNLSVNVDWRGNPPTVPASEIAPLRRSAIQFERLHENISPPGQPLLVVASSGNDSGDRVIDARLGAAWSYAALERGYGNVLVVEAVELDASAGPAARRAIFSNVGGHLSAPGVGVLSTDADNGYALREGTSMAAPFVTGLVSYLLALDPELSNTQIIDILTGTAEDVLPSSDGTPGSPGADAFAAALAIDGVRGNDRILRMLLDIDDGTPDGNQRVDPGSPETPFYDTDADLNGRPGDGAIDMSDFRRWRDLFLEFQEVPDLSLNGPASHPKRDLNGNGLVEGDPDASLFPLADFNGDGKLSVGDAASMAGHLAGAGPLTDLGVLEALFDDPYYEADQLVDLVESGDILVQLSDWVLEHDGAGEVGSTVELVDGENVQLVDSRFHTMDESVQIYTVGRDELAYRVSAWILGEAGDTVCIVRHEVLVTPGSDSYWQPSCAPTVEVEVGLDAAVEPGVATPVVVRAGVLYPGGTLQYRAGLDLALSVTGGSAAALTGTTNEDGFFGTTVVMDDGAEEMRVTALVSDPDIGISGSGSATAVPIVLGGRILVLEHVSRLDAAADAGIDPICQDRVLEVFTEIVPESWDLALACSGDGYGEPQSSEVTSAGSLGFTLATDGTSLTGISAASTHAATLSAPTSSGALYAGGRTNFSHTMTFSVSGGPAAYEVSGSGATDSGRVYFALFPAGDTSNPVWRENYLDGRVADFSQTGVLEPGTYELVVIYDFYGLAADASFTLTWP